MPAASESFRTELCLQWWSSDRDTRVLHGWELPTFGMQGWKSANKKAAGITDVREVMASPKKDRALVAISQCKFWLRMFRIRRIPKDVATLCCAKTAFFPSKGNFCKQRVWKEIAIVLFYSSWFAGCQWTSNRKDGGGFGSRRGLGAGRDDEDSLVWYQRAVAEQNPIRFSEIQQLHTST